MDAGGGLLASSIVTADGDTALTVANTTFGRQLSAGVDQDKQAGVTVSCATLLASAAPMDIRIDHADPLPGNAGNGLTAFYYACLPGRGRFHWVSDRADSPRRHARLLSGGGGPRYRLIASMNLAVGTLVIGGGSCC